ncbi:hypothetical protein MP638_003028 [Amoeboaphelidium occidentale]|nr:hypothetical protein MP638_003028 [Amoeboaphelidium occidentale]
MTSDRINVQQQSDAKVSEDVAFSKRLYDAISRLNAQEESDINLKAIESLLNVAASNEYTWHVDGQGMSPLHLAASRGLRAVCEMLIRAGHPWNALNNDRKTPAELAKSQGYDEIHEFLLEEAVRSEMLLNLVPAEERESYGDYLMSSVTYTENDDLVSDGNKAGVMMKWERPLMKLHAKIMCNCEDEVLKDYEDVPVSRSKILEDYGHDQDCNNMVNYDEEEEEEAFVVLNVGFGLGLVDSYIHQCLLLEFKKNPKRKYKHYIIEAHPQVIHKMQQLGWYNEKSKDSNTDDRVQVHAIEGKWQDVISNLLEDGIQFDGIFFDTFGEYYKDMQEFHEHVVNLLKPDGSYTFFNGLGGTNPFFNEVYSEIVDIELQDMGLQVEWRFIDNLGISTDSTEWEGLERPYFTLSKYRLPIAKPQSL